MRAIERDLDLILTRLRNVIRERGFTQVEVQEVLGWGKSYISQLLTKQKSLRTEQILLILNVIGVDPGVFFDKVYLVGEGGPTTAHRKHGRHTAAPSRSGGLNEESTLAADLLRLKRLLEGLVNILTRKNLITATDLASAVEKAKREQSQPLSPPD